MKFIKPKSITKILDTSKISRISYRSDINGLRAVAVAGVVFYHADIKIFNGGWIGVDVFFVISGFLISNIIISELNSNNFSFKNFYIRRIRRIIPALFSTVLFSLPFSYWLLTPRAMLEFSKSISASILFYSNYYFQNLDFYNAEPTKVMPLLHTWSLAIEEQFYIIFPLFCFILFKFFKRNLVIGMLIFFLFSIFLNSTTNDLIKFYQIQFRGWELIFGALVMILYLKYKIKYIEYLGILLVMFSFIYFDDSMMTLNSLEPRLVGVVGSGMILASNSENIIYKSLSNKYLGIIGVSSYSIYLFHQPLFAFYRLFQERNSYDDLKIYTYLLLFALLFISYIHRKYVEIYFQKNKLSTLFFYIIFCLIISFLFISLANNSNGFEKRYDYVPDEVLYYSNFPNIYPSSFDIQNYLFENKDCDNKLGEGSFCIWYDTKSDSTIYLIGDSQTNALSVSLLTNLTYAQQKYNLAFISNTPGRCLLSQQSDTPGTVEYCNDEFFLNFLTILDKEKDIVIAFGSFDTWLTDKGKNELKCTNCDYLNIFSNRLETISRNVSKLLIIEPIPTYNFSIADSYLYKNKTWGEPITLDLSQWREKMKDTDNFISNLKLQNTEIIKSTPIFCDFDKKNQCYASTESELYYSDSNHLTLTGADLLTDRLNKLLFLSENE
tara:strand:+ start:10760 stop:12754 length:1995 start_codon:yes stop_codon:yes gene_type:complete